MPDAWRATRTIRIGLVVGASKLLVAGSTEWDLFREGGDRIATLKPGDRLRVVRMGPTATDVYREGEMAPLWSGGPADTLLLTPQGGGYSG